MFAFFSNRLGCIGSLIVSIVGSLVLILVLRGCGAFYIAVMVAPQPSRPSDAEVLDAIVIGGGPAGLSAALVLGRCLRRVLVCDAGHPRNEPARIFNGFLSRDGSTPAEFLQICRDQLRRYETIEFRKVKVVHVERGDCRFTAILETGERVAGQINAASI